MSEKLAEVYEQYDMDIISTRKGRGSTIIETADGLRILEPFRGSMARLEQEYVLKQLFLEKGAENIDYIIPNRDGQLFTCDKYRQPFVLKKHFDGRECDMHDPDDVLAAIDVMADFHKWGQEISGEFESRCNETRRQREEMRVEEIRRAIEDGEEMERIAYLYEISRSALEKAIKNENEHKNGSKHSEITAELSSEDVRERFIRHNAQIKKIGGFVSKVKRRNAFENLFLQVYGEFHAQGVECVSMLGSVDDTAGDKTAWELRSSETEGDKVTWELKVAEGEGAKVDRKLRASGKEDEKASRHYGICHGSFNQHNVILCQDVNALVHFERFTRGNQLGDLYQFSRKAMEKNHFDFELLLCMFSEYSKKIELFKDDYRYLYILFSYPEKFWKIANSYYNSNKAFLSPKYLEKLQTLIYQEKEKKEMLDRMKTIVFE